MQACCPSTSRGPSNGLAIFVGIFNSVRWKKTPGNSAGAPFLGMVKTWPFQGLQVTSNVWGSKGHFESPTRTQGFWLATLYTPSTRQNPFRLNRPAQLLYTTQPTYQNVTTHHGAACDRRWFPWPKEGHKWFCHTDELTRNRLGVAH